MVCDRFPPGNSIPYLRLKTVVKPKNFSMTSSGTYILSLTLDFYSINPCLLAKYWTYSFQIMTRIAGLFVSLGTPYVYMAQWNGLIFNGITAKDEAGGRSTSYLLLAQER
jgi:hypothetical protein